jgi:hypothetical protein
MTTGAYGTDVSTFVTVDGVTGLDPLFAELSGERVVLERCARRLMTSAGQLPGAPEFGFDLARILGKRIESATAKARLKARIADELLKDEAVLAVGVVDLVTTGDFAWQLTLRIELATGPFRLVLGIADVTVAILRADRG